MGFARFEDSIGDEEIEVATDASGSQIETLTDDNGGRWAIFEDRTSDRIAGAELVDFHNSIVS
jgi:hypothetical protein